MKLFIFSIAVALVSYAGPNVWTPVGPYGGYLTALAADPSNPGTLYAGTGGVAGAPGGLYKTTDGGTNWTLLNPVLGAASIAIDPQNTNTIYVGLRGSGNSGAWVFKSTDAGASFNLSNSGLVELFGSLIADPQKPGTVYAVSYGRAGTSCNQNCTEVFKTTDGGASWSLASSGLPGTNSLISALAFDPQDSSILYAGLYGLNGSTSGIFKSTNGGASWGPLNLSVQVCCAYSSQGLVIDPLNRDTLYAASNSGIVRLSASTGTILSTSALGAGVVSALAFDPQNPATMYAATGGGGDSSSVFRSTNSGNSWTTTAFASPGYGSISVLVADPVNSGTVYTGTIFDGTDYAGTFYGVVKTVDGGESWTDMSKGIDGIFVVSVTVDPQNSGTLYAADQAGRELKTTDGGKTWIALQELPTQAPNSGPVTVDPRDSNTLYVVNGDSVWKSSDGGSTWNHAGEASFAAAAAALGPNGYYTFPGALVLDPQNPEKLYVLADAPLPAGPCCRTDVFKSTDGGSSWAVTASFTGNHVNLLAMDPQNSSTLYAASSYRTTISKSTDGGMTWRDSTLPPEAFTNEDDEFWAFANSLAVDPRNSNVAYASGSGGVFKSTDGGTTWTTMNSGLPPCAQSNCGEPYQVRSLIIDARSLTLYAISRDGEIIKNRGGGSVWVTADDGLPTLVRANSLALDPSDPSIYAAVSDGVYSITLCGDESQSKGRTSESCRSR